MTLLPTVRSRFSVRILSLQVAILFLSGCGTSSNDPYDRHAVSGIVHLDGQPLADGAIIFYPLGHGPVVSGTAIHEGTFTLPVSQGLPIGTYKVSITSTITSEPISDDPEVLITSPPSAQSLIPEQYNTHTTLTCEVRKQDDNLFTFELTTK